YVDIRIPKGRPRCRGRRSFRELTKSEIRRLAAQQGFAGMARMAGRRCTWSREIDYQPDSGRPDTARLRIEGEVLSETGKASSAIGSDYEEIYVRERRGDELCAALRLAGSGRRPSAILVLLDDRFLFARARRVRLPVGPSLQDVVDEAEG